MAPKKTLVRCYLKQQALNKRKKSTDIKHKYTNRLRRTETHKNTRAYDNPSNKKK